MIERESVNSASAETSDERRRFLKGTLLADGAAFADFGVTQAVDGNWGVHAIIEKSIFAGSETV